MHPEIRQDQPGSGPKCGMALEPLIPSLEYDNPELKDFTRRFWWTLPFTIVVTVLAMFGHQLGWFGMPVQSWIELVLSIPVVLWAGAPFFVRGGTLVIPVFALERTHALLLDIASLITSGLLPPPRIFLD